MNERVKRRAPTEEERLRVWREWLDGHSVHAIHRYDLDDQPVAVVRQILAEEPPEEILTDLRYRLGARFFWIASSGIANPVTGKKDALVVVQSPRTYTATAFRAAIRSIRRDARTAGGDVDFGVIEGVDADAAVRMVNNRGYRLYRFDETGAVEPVRRIEVPDPDEVPGSPGP